MEKDGGGGERERARAPERARERESCPKLGNTYIYRKIEIGTTKKTKQILNKIWSIRGMTINNVIHKSM